MPNGLLIVNQFLNTEKFKEHYRWLKNACDERRVSLEIRTNADFFVQADNGTVKSDAFQKGLPDFILFWDKDIRLAHALEAMGLRLYNCADAIAVCDDKSLTATALAGVVRQPRTFLAPMTYSNIGYTDFSFLKQIENELSYPFVIKECFGSFGMQVSLVSTPKEAESVLAQNAGNSFLFQEYISTSTGRDVRLHVVGGQVVTAMLRYNEHDFRANITNGGSMKPYAPTKQQKALAIKVCDSLKLDFAGVDILFGENEEPILCEVNSNAHFKNIYDCTGINVADAIIDYIIP